jgi:hypothetical protein
MRRGAESPGQVDPARAHRWSLDPGNDRRLLLRSLAVIFSAGPSVFLVALLAAAPPAGQLVAMTCVAGGAYAAVPIMLRAPERLPSWAPDVFYAFGVGLVTAVIAIPHRPASPYALFYLWLTLHAAYFLTPRRLVFHIATVAAAYAAVTAAISGTAEIARYVVTCGTIALIGWLVKLLALRAQRLVSDLDGMASTDCLTAVGNRRALDVALEGLIARFTPLTIAVFDLDGFKAYNDAFGHPAGDALLARLAARVADAIAPHG